MGCHHNIDHDKYPKQGTYLNKNVLVTFHYDTEREQKGKILRDDDDDPYRIIILLDDGRVVLGSECQWRLGE